jgi:DNA-binding MarR family transcriptional regulator
MGEVAEAMSCDASNVTGLVDRLESRGLLQRVPSDADRRVKVLRLTPLGRKVRAALVERMTSSPPTLERLSEADQRALARIMRRLLE